MKNILLNLYEKGGTNPSHKETLATSLQNQIIFFEMNIVIWIVLESVVNEKYLSNLSNKGGKTKSEEKILAMSLPKQVISYKCGKSNFPGGRTVLFLHWRGSNSLKEGLAFTLVENIVLTRDFRGTLTTETPT